MPHPRAALSGGRRAGWCVALVAALLVVINAMPAAAPSAPARVVSADPLFKLFGETPLHDGAKYMCVIVEPWVNPTVNLCQILETDYTENPAGLDLTNVGTTTFPGALQMTLVEGPLFTAALSLIDPVAGSLVGPTVTVAAAATLTAIGCAWWSCSGERIIEYFLANPTQQNNLIGWSKANPEGVVVVGSAGAYNADADERCAVGEVVHLAITWDGDIHADLGPVGPADTYPPGSPPTPPSVAPLINNHNAGPKPPRSELISEPALTVEIPAWDRASLPALASLRGHQVVRICGRWVTDTNSDEGWNELHPVTSLEILSDTAPAVTVPADMAVEATSASGAVATFSASALDAVEIPLTPICTPASGATFPLGPTTVNCTATDSRGNEGSGSFTVTVHDTTPPVVTVPVDMTVEATSASGAVADFTASALDIVDGSRTPTCSPASGATFPLGLTTVSCTATDSHSNEGSGSFTVTVHDTTPPVITVPANMTVEATSASGAVATFTASALDIVDGSIAPTCTPASGATFPLGPTTVSCTATDSHSNANTRTFGVTVRDTTPPTVTVPVDLTSVLGAGVTFTASAVDYVDGSTTPTCTPASGAAFPLGPTTVSCTAADSRGNVGAKTFVVTVIFAPAGAMCLGSPGHAILQPIDLTGSSVFKRRSTVQAKFRVCDANGVSVGPPIAVVDRFRLYGTFNGTVLPNINEEVPVVSTTPDSNFRWSSSDQQWIFNINTTTLPADVTYVYRVYLTDGTFIQFQFGLK